MFKKSCLAALFFATGAACAGSGDGSVDVDSELTGVYRIERYVGNQDGCDSPTATIAPNAFLVLYGFHPAHKNLDDVFLGGNFCTDVKACRQIAKNAPQPQIGYSFVNGTDEDGWEGWAMLGGDVLGDQCLAVVQEHTLAKANGSPARIRIETRTVQTGAFAPSAQEGNEIECRVADAIAAVAGQPCREILILEATRESAL